MLVVPQQITEFTSSNIYDDYADYNPATTYSFEPDTTTLTNASMAAYDSFYWRSFTTGNLGNTPELGSSYWTKYSISNKRAMLDLSANSITTTEADHTETSDTTTADYEVNERIHNTTSDAVYRCILDATSGTLLTNATYFEESTFDLVVEFSRGQIQSLVLGNFEASQVIIEGLDDLGAVISETVQTFTYGVNETVVDIYTYMYDAYSFAVDRNLYVPLIWLGSKVRVTFKRGIYNKATCGFLIGGEPVYMGETIDALFKGFNSYSTKNTDKFGTISITKRAIQDTVDFPTKFPTSEFMEMERAVKTYLDDIVAFVVDPSEASEFENLITLGVMEAPRLGLKANDTNSFVDWVILEEI